MTFWKKLERIGYLRAAGHMARQGFPDLAKKLQEEADAVE
jgi:hypothetical protein